MLKVAGRIRVPASKKLFQIPTNSSHFYHYRVPKPFHLHRFTLLHSSQTYSRHSFHNLCHFFTTLHLNPLILIFPVQKQKKRETQTIFKSRLFRTLGRQNIAAVTNRVGGVEGMTLWPKKLDSKAIFECRQKKYQQQSLQKKIKHQQA